MFRIFEFRIIYINAFYHTAIKISNNKANAMDGCVVLSTCMTRKYYNQRPTP